MEWTFSADLPIYSQLVDQIKLAIVSGVYLPGERLAPVRELAMDAGVNPNTMQKALALLESTGLLYTQRTAGRRVTESQELIHCLRLEQAHTHIDQCRRQLAALGFSPEEIREMLQSWTEPAEETEKE